MNWALILDILSWVLFLTGSLFVFAGALGLVRFPDFYTRIHAGGVTDTFGSELILLAMVLQSDDFTTVIKLFLIALFLLLTSPVSTHSIAHAAWVGKLKPLVGKQLRYPEGNEHR